MEKTKKELEEEIDGLKELVALEAFYRRRAEEKHAELVRILQDMRNHHNGIATLFDRCSPGEDHARNR